MFYIEIDECSNGEHNCSHTCINTPGSYHCECPKGFVLAEDLVTCKGKVKLTHHLINY